MRKIKIQAGDTHFFKELKKLSMKEELMILGLCQKTKKLIWTQAPAWSILSNCINALTVYHVPEPSKRIEKVFKTLPVNSRLPLSFIEVPTEISAETQADLDDFKSAMLSGEFTFEEAFA